jgi:DNA-binding IclR family transcriptional regulator
MMGHYIGADEKKEKILRLFLTKEEANTRDFIRTGIAKEELDDLLRDMVRNNILYFDSTEGLYYPQGKSYREGIRLFFESINNSP